MTLPAGTTPTITDRDFAIANIQAPSGLRSEESEEEAAGRGLIPRAAIVLDEDAPRRTAARLAFRRQR